MHTTDTASVNTSVELMFLGQALSQPQLCFWWQWHRYQYHYYSHCHCHYQQCCRYCQLYVTNVNIDANENNVVTVNTLADAADADDTVSAVTAVTSATVATAATETTRQRKGVTNACKVKLRGVCKGETNVCKIWTMEVSCKFWPRGGDDATGPDGFGVPVGYHNFSRAVLLYGLWGDQGYGIHFILCKGFVVFHFQCGTQVIHHMVYKSEVEVKHKVRVSLYQGRRIFNPATATATAITTATVITHCHHHYTLPPSLHTATNQQPISNQSATNQPPITLCVTGQPINHTHSMNYVNPKQTTWIHNRQAFLEFPKSPLDADFVLVCNDDILNPSQYSLTSDQKEKTRQTRAWMRKSANESTAKMVVISTYTNTLNTFWLMNFCMYHYCSFHCYYYITNTFCYTILMRCSWSWKLYGLFFIFRMFQ